MKNNIFIVIPSIRNLDFLKFWGNEFKHCHLIIVEDRENKNISTENLKFASIAHFCHSDIEENFGKNSWIFSRRNAGIRSYGFWKAYHLGAEIIITIDDDCYPVEKNFIAKHVDNLNFKVPFGWINTYPNPKFLFTRGIPYSNREEKPVVISHGLWSGALDLDAKTEICFKTIVNEKPYLNFRQIIPKGYYYSMCSMNLAFRKEVTPLMFFPMMGQKPDGTAWKYNRYDDIWAGIFSKKIIDHLNLAVVNGSPFVNHKKMSNSLDNFKKEKNGMRVNEFLWKKVDEVELTKENPKDCYVELSKKINFPKEKYFDRLRQAMIIWANLF